MHQLTTSCSEIFPKNKNIPFEITLLYKKYNILWMFKIFNKNI